MSGILKLAERPCWGATLQTAPRPSSSQRRLHLSNQSTVFNEAQTVIHFPLRLAPGHDLISAKAAITAHNNPDLGATLSDGCHDLFQRGYYARSGVQAAGAQLCPQRNSTHKHIERQITIPSVEGVEVPPFLHSVNQVAHRV